MPRTPFMPTDDQKTAALGHIHYEIAQFCLCLEGLMKLPKPPQFWKNILLEGMVIHARVLTDFFEEPLRSTDQREKEKDDVLCSDFAFTPLGTGKLGLPEDYRHRTNKEVAHLSYARFSRVTPEQKAWHVQDTLPLILKCLEFVDSRSPEELQRLERYRAENGLPPLS